MSNPTPTAAVGEPQEGALDRETAAEEPLRPPVRLVAEGDLDVRSAPDLQREVSRALDSGSGDLELDLSEVAFLDSSALGALVQIKRTVEDDGRALHVVGVSTKVMRVLRLTGLDALFFPQEETDDSPAAAH